MKRGVREQGGLVVGVYAIPETKPESRLCSLERAIGDMLLMEGEEGKKRQRVAGMCEGAKRRTDEKRRGDGGAPMTFLQAEPSQKDGFACAASGLRSAPSILEKPRCGQEALAAASERHRTLLEAMHGPPTGFCSQPWSVGWWPELHSNASVGDSVQLPT